MNSSSSLQDLIADVKEHGRGMWRYKWIAVIAAWTISIGGWTYVYLMPDTYLATAKVYLDTESLMDPMFEGLAIRDNLGRQAEMVSRALLTRPNLEKVAIETDLHLRAEGLREMERLITNLQRDVSVRADTRRNTFEITFEDRNRAKAQEVVAAIVSAFVENSLEDQGDDAAFTARAVNAELANHERRLRDADESLAEFKKKNLGYMPTDRGDYYSRLQRGIDQMDDLQLKIRSLEQVRAELLRQLQSESPVADGSEADDTVTANCSQRLQIVELEAQLAELELNFTDRHPRIQSLRETIDGLIDRCRAEWDSTLSNGMVPTGADGESLDENPVYQNIRIQLTNTDVELASLRAELTQLKSGVDELRENVDKIADVETQLKQLNRDYDVVQTRYQELLKRRETLQTKERIGPAVDAVPFRTLEPPFAAAQPTGPKRGLMIAAVFLVSIGFGGVLAFGISQLNPVFFTRRSLRRFSDRPVLGSVSALTAPSVQRRKLWGSVLWFGSCATLLVMTAAVVVLQSPASAFLRQIFGAIGI